MERRFIRGGSFMRRETFYRQRLITEGVVLGMGNEIVNTTNLSFILNYLLVLHNVFQSLEV